ncbi:zincin-like metallopeptidase domain-containing protein [Sphingomonas oligophenolica]|uniref:Zincin-like metallopeptidase domain-containing protein n=1 Tax=Sphingomonas oligophenolica TaxID=301154 RepID=A0ABU9Y271_9SPHN
MTAEVLSHSRFDVYRAVTDSIIAAIEAGAGEFVMPWHDDGVAIAKPQNALTQMEYHGINVLALWAQADLSGYRSGYWASYRQWQHAGAQVVKGAEGSTIVFFKRIEGEPAEGEPTSVRLVARASRVFNADQVAGWQPPAPSRSYGDAQTTESVETFIAATKALVHRGGSIACYHITDDYIEMPERSRFIGSTTISATEAYSATLLHELVHWAGARHRLARFGEGLSKDEVPAEELVAEIGAAFLCADLGVSNQPRPDHAAYVAHWLQLLKNDARAIFTASRLANQAATYLHEMASTSDW